MDIDGDGIADFVESPASGPFLQARYGSGQRGGLLIRQENGLGATVDVTYVPSTDPGTAGLACSDGTNAGAWCLADSECPGSTCTAPCYECSHLPFNTWVVRSLRTQSGFAGDGNDLSTEFTFTGGYFDPVGRQFRGFRQSVQKRVADGRLMRRRFEAPPFATSTSPPWPAASAPARPFKLIDGQVLDASAKPFTRTTVDDAGNLVSQDDPQTNQHIEVCYDPLNRVTRKLYLAGDAQWSPPGGLCPPTALGNTDYLDYTYDCGTYGVGRLCSVQETRSGAARFTGFSHDARGRVTRETIMQDVTVNGQLFSGSYAQSFGYDAADRLVSLWYPVDVAGGAEVLQYGYNELAGLDALSSANQIYDNLGNMTTSGSLSFTLDAGKPHQVAVATPPGGGSPFQHDRNGALTVRPDTDGTGADTAKTIEYDAEGWAKKVTTADGHTVESLYDFRGQRAVRIVDAGQPGQQVSVFYGK